VKISIFTRKFLFFLRKFEFLTDFWRKFGFLAEISIFGGNSIFGYHFDFGPKISILNRKLDFGSKLRLLTKISIFDQILIFSPKFEFLNTKSTEYDFKLESKTFQNVWK